MKRREKIQSGQEKELRKKKADGVRSKSEERQDREGSKGEQRTLLKEKDIQKRREREGGE